MLGCLSSLQPAVAFGTSLLLRTLATEPRLVHARQALAAVVPRAALAFAAPESNDLCI